MKEKIGAKVEDTEWRARKRNSTGGQAAARGKGSGAKPSTLYTAIAPALVPLREGFGLGGSSFIHSIPVLAWITCPARTGASSPV